MRSMPSCPFAGLPPARFLVRNSIAFASVVRRGRQPPRDARQTQGAFQSETSRSAVRRRRTRVACASRATKSVAALTAAARPAGEAAGAAEAAEEGAHRLLVRVELRLGQDGLRLVVRVRLQVGELLADVRVPEPRAAP